MAEWDSENSPNDQDNYSYTDKDKTQGSSNADAAKFNAGEQEHLVIEKASTEYNTNESINGR